ncbi:hypothetical protein CHS0354_013858 [Potamilus streckersoni]|uniref:Uncharacterized protein n=1 Tax=Potamilus streckersoni TaxID=2493646 RepID=A0AAE0T5S8_9BIVA|nr:hypothetical protein CHS0354_013858 [Potamilus streckersoni]
MDEVKRKIREAYSHIMNGSNGQFPHKKSKVIRDKENSYIEALPYLEDLHDWDHVHGVKILPEFDIAMLFTTLGAEHDGEGDAAACKSEDFFIMANQTININKQRLHIKNMWLFSNCSVESFKKTLKHKQCVHNIGTVYDLNEWTTFMKNQPGDVFTPQEQCFLLFGPGSTFYGVCIFSI